MPAHQLTVGPLDPVSRMHRFGKPRPAHLFSASLYQIVAQSDHQSPASTLGTRTLFLYWTAVTLITPLYAVVLGLHVVIFNAAALSAQVALRTNRLTFVDINMEPIRKISR